MGLLKTVYDKLHPAPETMVHTSPETRAEVMDAQARAIDDLQAVVQNEPQISAVVGSLHEQLIRNHFGELVEASMRGRG